MSTSGPPRFKDDPEALRELGGDLSDEARLLSDHDLGALEAGLKGKIAAGATGAPSGVGASAVATGVVLALVVGGGAYLWLRAPNPEVVSASATKVAEAPRARKLADDRRSRRSAEGDRIADTNAVGAANSELQPKLRVEGAESTQEEPSARDASLRASSAASHDAARTDGMHRALGDGALAPPPADIALRASGDAARADARRRAPGGERPASAEAMHRAPRDRPPFPGGADSAGREPVAMVSGRDSASASAIAPDSAPVGAPGGAPPALVPTPARAGGPGDAPPLASSLAAELADYDVGRRALRAGRFDDAAAAFEGYRTRFPAGRLRHEAAVGLLESRFRAGQFAQARVIAAEVERGLLAAAEDSPSADGAPGPRPAWLKKRAEIWRLVGETYALTGACPESARALNRARALSAEAAPDAVVERALDGCRRASP